MTQAVIRINRIRMFSSISSFLSNPSGSSRSRTSSTSGASGKLEKTICLFDVDGTLTKSRQKVTGDMEEFIEKLKSRVSVGLVGGSDMEKIVEQMGGKGHDRYEATLDILNRYEFIFAENGLVAYKRGVLLGKESILNFLGEDKTQKLINFCLEYMSRLNLPHKRGNFVEFRTGLINICPTGRSCSQQERDHFVAFDSEHRVRSKFVDALKQNFEDWDLCFVTGGQISIDIFPKGWDKTYCLKYLNIPDDYEKIYFFGDKTMAGGNDYEIYNDSRTIGYTVDSPDHTKQILTQLFSL